MTRYTAKETRGGKKPDRYTTVNQILAIMHPRFDGKKFSYSATVEEACHKVGISESGFQYWLKTDPALKEMWERGKEDQKNAMIAAAMGNVQRALYGDVKLRPKELVDVSLRFLEKVSEKFKDRVELSGMESTKMFGTSIDDLLKRAKELSAHIEENREKLEDAETGMAEEPTEEETNEK